MRGYLKSLIKCSLLIDSISQFTESIGAAFIDHGCYENGIYFEMLSRSGIPIYYNDYPYGLVRWEPKAQGGYEDALQVCPVDTNDEQIEQGKKELEFVTNGSSAIPYLIVDFNSYESGGDFDYIIYSHSFTDAQNIYGYDGAFNNILDWLEYTVLKLSGARICIKSHPGIYAEGYTSQVVDWDRKLFRLFAEKYSNHPNVSIIDYAIRNADLLKSVGRETILVSHHSNALLEAGSMGFKCICSSATNWTGFTIFNTWHNEDEYQTLLDKSFSDLAPTNERELFRYYYILRHVNGSYFSWHWLDTVADITGVSREVLVKDPTCIDHIAASAVEECVQAVSERIVTY